MLRTVMIGLVGFGTLLWSVFSVAGQSLSFPEPSTGYRNTMVGYHDLPPLNPTQVDLGTVHCSSPKRTVSDFRKQPDHDGIEVFGRIKGITSKRASYVCVAVDFSRQTKQERQLIATTSLFFEVGSGEASYRLPIRFPEYDDSMDVSVVAIVVDKEGTPIGSEFTIATWNANRL